MWARGSTLADACGAAPRHTGQSPPKPRECSKVQLLREMSVVICDSLRTLFAHAPNVPGWRRTDSRHSKDPMAFEHN